MNFGTAKLGLKKYSGFKGISLLQGNTLLNNNFFSFLLIIKLIIPQWAKSPKRQSVGVYFCKNTLLQTVFWQFCPLGLFSSKKRI